MLCNSNFAAFTWFTETEYSTRVVLEFGIHIEEKRDGRWNRRKQRSQGLRSRRVRLISCSKPQNNARLDTEYRSYD